MRVCTVIRSAQLAEARVLAETLRNHEPGNRLLVLITDDPYEGTAPRQNEEFEVVPAWRLGIERGRWRALATSYDEYGFAAALRPWLIRTVLPDSRQPVLYADPTTAVLAPLTPIHQLAIRHGVVVFPRRAHPHRADPARADPARADPARADPARADPARADPPNGPPNGPDDEALLRASPLDSGLAAITREAGPLLDWWCARMELGLPPEHWIGLVPALFAVHISRSAPISTWNPGEEGGHPLARFERFDVARAWLADPGQPWPPATLVGRAPLLARALRDRAAALAKHVDGPPSPYRWHVDGNGAPLDAVARTVYARALTESQQGRATATPPDPLALPDEFDRWLRRPGPTEPPGVSRYLLGYYRSRGDLQVAFPDLTDQEDRAAYLTWVLRHGATAGLASRWHQVRAPWTAAPGTAPAPSPPDEEPTASPVSVPSAKPHLSVPLLLASAAPRPLCWHAGKAASDPAGAASAAAVEVFVAAVERPGDARLRVVVDDDVQGDHARFLALDRTDIEILVDPDNDRGPEDAEIVLDFGPGDGGASRWASGGASPRRVLTWDPAGPEPAIVLPAGNIAASAAALRRLLSAREN